MTAIWRMIEFLTKNLNQLESIKAQHEPRAMMITALQSYLASCLSAFKDGFRTGDYEYSYQILSRMINDESDEQNSMWFVFIDQMAEKRYLDDLFEYIFSIKTACFLTEFDAVDHANDLDNALKTEYGVQIIEDMEQVMITEQDMDEYDAQMNEFD